MAKKRKQNNQYIPFIIIILGIATFCMIFLNCLKTGEGDNTTYLAGTDLVFGRKITFLGQSITYKFSFLGFLAFTLPIIAGVVAVIPVARKSRMIKFLGAALLLIVSAVLCFIMPSYIKVYYDFFQATATLNISYSLAIGAILAGSMSILSAIISIALGLKK